MDLFLQKYDKHNDFDFDIVNFPFLDGDVARRASYGVYISQLILMAYTFHNMFQIPLIIAR